MVGELVEAVRYVYIYIDVYIYIYICVCVCVYVYITGLARRFSAASRGSRAEL